MAKRVTRVKRAKLNKRKAQQLQLKRFKISVAAGACAVTVTSVAVNGAVNVSANTQTQIESTQLDETQVEMTLVDIATNDEVINENVEISSEESEIDTITKSVEDNSDVIIDKQIEVAETTTNDNVSDMHFVTETTTGAAIEFVADKVEENIEEEILDLSIEANQPIDMSHSLRHPTYKEGRQIVFLESNQIMKGMTKEDALNSLKRNHGNDLSEAGVNYIVDSNGVTTVNDVADKTMITILLIQNNEDFELDYVTYCNAEFLIKDKLKKDFPTLSAIRGTDLNLTFKESFKDSDSSFNKHYKWGRFTDCTDLFDGRNERLFEVIEENGKQYSPEAYLTNSIIADFIQYYKN